MKHITTLSALAMAIGLLVASLEGDVSQLLIGSLMGIITGLVPGLHINSFIPFLDSSMTAFVIGVAVSHSFFDFIPAILIGAPDESAALSILPSHKMLLRGKALEAFQLTILGGFFSGLLAIAMLPLLNSFSEFQFLIPPVLILSLLMVIHSTNKKFETVLIMIASALLGSVAFESSYGLPAILSGFFGVSTIIYSIIGNSKIPAQRASAETRISFKEVCLGSISGCIAGLFPGLSSSVTATMVSPKMRHKQFLTIIGGTNTVYSFIAILAIHLIGRPRSGAGILIQKAYPSPLFLIGLCLAALGASAFLAWHLSKTIVVNFNRIDYRKLSFVALAIVLLLNIINGADAFLLMSIASIIGLFCLYSGARRSSCMASLIIPVLLYYLL